MFIINHYIPQNRLSPTLLKRKQLLFSVMFKKSCFNVFLSASDMKNFGYFSLHASKTPSFLETFVITT